jgi:hypothetical protein
MGVTGNPDEIRRYGETFRRTPETEPAVSWEPPYSPDGPLSDGLAIVQNQKATAATDFASTKDRGIVAAGDGLVRIAENLAEFDREGAAAIKRLFPDPAPGTGGGQ